MVAVSSQAEQISSIRGMVDLGTVASHFGASRRTIQDWVRRGRFPKPIRVGHRTNRWDVQKLNAWIAKGCPSTK